MTPEELPKPGLESALDGVKLVYSDVRLPEIAINMAKELILIFLFLPSYVHLVKGWSCGLPTMKLANHSNVLADVTLNICLMKIKFLNSTSV